MMPRQYSIGLFQQDPKHTRAFRFVSVHRARIIPNAESIAQWIANVFPEMELSFDVMSSLDSIIASGKETGYIKIPLYDIKTGALHHVEFMEI